MSEETYLYRGTIRGFPGGATSLAIPMTSTSTDPLVATIFGLACQRHGEAVVLIARRAQFQGVLHSHNWFADVEREVALELPPAEFEKHSLVALPVQRCRDILIDMGFTNLPAGLADYDALRAAIHESDRREERLDREQLATFTKWALGAMT
jgi:hypothetical protein